MKKCLMLLFVLLFALSMFVACGSEKGVTKTGGEESGESDLVVMDDPFQDLTDLANVIIDGGGVAAVGQGVSGRQDLAQKKAITDAQGKLAEIFNTKVQRMKKSFVEEIGSADDSEINEAFTEVTKTLTSTMLQGAITKKTKYMRDKATKNVTCGVIVAIEPNKVNMSILDEMKNKKPKLYERFRASQAYEELKGEMENYEKQQNQGF